MTFFEKYLHTGGLKNPGTVASGLGHAEGVVVTRRITTYRARAAGHTNSLTRMRKTHRNVQLGLIQQAQAVKESK